MARILKETNKTSRVGFVLMLSSSVSFILGLFWLSYPAITVIQEIWRLLLPGLLVIAIIPVVYFRPKVGSIISIILALPLELLLLANILGDNNIVPIRILFVSIIIYVAGAIVVLISTRGE